MHFLNKEVFLFLPRKQQSLAPWELRGGGGTVGRVGTQPAHLFGGLGTRFESKPGGKGPVPTGSAIEQTRKLTGPQPPTRQGLWGKLGLWETRAGPTPSGWGPGHAPSKEVTFHQGPTILTLAARIRGFPVGLKPGIPSSFIP